jgi:hypothetical protein
MRGPAPVRRRVGAVGRSGAFVLGGPGTYVEYGADRVVVGNRPGAFHFAVAVVFPLGLLFLWWLLRDAGCVGALFFLVMGVPPLLILFNTQQWEIVPGALRARGRAFGIARSRDWTLPPDGGVRVERFQDSDGWTTYQIQIGTAEGWIGVAEAANPEPVRELGARVAEVAGVPFAG